MDRERFERLVEKAVENLPDEFRDRLENIDIVVEDRPSAAHLRTMGKRRRGETLLGLYEGVPLTVRSSHYGMVVPDKITIFQETIESQCRSEREIVGVVRRVVLHEIAHHFGISDATLKRLGMG